MRFVMKKRIALLALLTSLTVLLLDSCKSTSQCPAYSQAEVEQVQTNG
jgi:hypothetical protein